MTKGCSTRAFWSLTAAMAVSLPAYAFPEGAEIPSTSAVTERLQGKVFTVNLRDGSVWRLEFRGQNIFVDTRAGQRTEGTWKAEDGKLCIQLRGRDQTCSDVRVFNDTLHVLRPDGEVIRYVPR